MYLKRVATARRRSRPLTSYENLEDNSMSKILRFLAICTTCVAFATLSIAWAQTYTTFDFPGATATTLNGGPSPQGTSVGS